MQGFARITAAVLLVAASANLAGCFTLAATGVAVGTLAVVDRRTLGAQTEDQAIELKAGAALRDKIVNSGGVGITSFNRRVLLTGQVGSDKERADAAAAVSAIDNVAGVFNEIAVSGRVGLGVSASDTGVTVKVKTALLRAEGVPANSIKVVTEASVVYLLGLLTADEAKLASEAVSRVSGVTKVVMLFEILTVEQAASLDHRSSAPSK